MVDGPGLSEADFDLLRDIHENGLRDYVNHGNPRAPDPNAVPVTCKHCGHEWEYRGRRVTATCSQCGLNTRIYTTLSEDGRGLTTPMCNAVRAAADDGKTYREIASLFNFLSDASCAHRHATGRCSHGRGDYPPVEPEREPGPQNGVDPEECAEMRRLYEQDASVREVASAIGRGSTTVHQHVSGECSHD